MLTEERATIEYVEALGEGRKADQNTAIKLINGKEEKVIWWTYVYWWT